VKRFFQSRLPFAGAVWRLVAAMLGVASLVAGAVAVFVTENGNGSAALIAAGTVLCLVAVMGEGAVITGPGGLGVQWPAKSNELLAEADAAEAVGDEQAARDLRSKAELLQELGPLAQRYGEARRRAAGPDRTAAMSRIVSDAVAKAETLALDRQAVSDLFNSGDEGVRLIALALMQREPVLGDPFALSQAIDNPRSAFELWNALLAARSVAIGGTLSPDEAASLRESLERAADTSLFEAHNRELAREVARLLRST
jgi:hypothetical protein